MIHSFLLLISVMLPEDEWSIVIFWFSWFIIYFHFPWEIHENFDEINSDIARLIYDWKQESEVRFI